MLPISCPVFVRSTVPINSNLQNSNLKQQIERIDLSFSSLKAIDPFSQTGFENVDNEIAQIGNIQNQASKIMEELENISTETAQLCDNMMLSLESENLRSQQDSARIRQLKSMGLDLDVCNMTAQLNTIRIC